MISLVKFIFYQFRIPLNPYFLFVLKFLIMVINRLERSLNTDLEIANTKIPKTIGTSISTDVVGNKFLKFTGNEYL